MFRPLFRLIERFPALAIFLRNIRDQLDYRQKPEKTPWGFMLAGDSLMASGNFEPEETELVRKILNEVDILVNVGANVGYYSCHSLSLGKPVIAIEPIARNLHYLLNNIRINGWSKQGQIFPVAVGAESDILRIWGGGTGASLIKGWSSNPSDYVKHVPVLTLDRILGDSLNGKRALILVDIEGAEFMMLQGAVQTLKNNPRPVWLIEICTTEHQPDGVGINPDFLKSFEVFFNNGYRAFTADAAQDEINIETVKDIVEGRLELKTHNFIFK